MENFNSKINASGEAKSRYANILLDYWFKRSFGTDINKRLMILLLREILPEAGVQDIYYNNKEHPNPIPGKHGVIFDIECTSNDGTKFIVEMQLAQQDSFMERAIFYASFTIQDQIEKGRKEYDFLPIYFIALMDFTLHDDGRFMYRYELLEKETGVKLSPNTYKLLNPNINYENIETFINDIENTNIKSFIKNMYDEKIIDDLESARDALFVRSIIEQVYKEERTTPLENKDQDKSER